MLEILLETCCKCRSSIEILGSDVAGQMPFCNCSRCPAGVCLNTVKSIKKVTFGPAATA